MTKQPSLTISKVDAAHRQLRTAITLWFAESDPVSTHTLVFAAYEVLHTVSKKRTPSRRDLLFDSDRIKDEYRSEFNKIIKKPAYFFKHADREPEGIINFDPNINVPFILFATIARYYCNIQESQEESTFLWWLRINRPQLNTELGGKEIANLFPVKTLESIRRMPKRDFFEGFRDTKYLRRRFDALAASHFIGVIK
ncbi:MAG TPA: hypothetical protein VHX43_01905 [Xanthobacteraceae bacterium]|jgi:hypothetical protein|nr:hypothetical protein [Xanthobacteraceae bacterium]